MVLSLFWMVSHKVGYGVFEKKLDGFKAAFTIESGTSL